MSERVRTAGCERCQRGWILVIENGRGHEEPCPRCNRESADGLTADEEARLRALLGIGPKPPAPDILAGGWTEQRWFNDVRDWNDLHNTDALLRFAAGRDGWLVSVTVGRGDCRAAIWTGLNPRCVIGTGPNPRTAIARAILKAAEDGG